MKQQKLSMKNENDLIFEGYVKGLSESQDKYSIEYDENDTELPYHVMDVVNNKLLKKFGNESDAQAYVEECE